MRQSIGIGAERKEALVKRGFRHRNLIGLLELFGVEVQNHRSVHKTDLQQVVGHGAGGRIGGGLSGVCERCGPHARADGQTRAHK